MASNIAIVSSATKYAYCRDGGVSLAGPLGALRVSPNGEVGSVAPHCGMDGYPAYSEATHPGELEKAIKLAGNYLAKAAK